MLVFVSNQPAWEEVRLDQHLEAIADAQHGQALLGFFDDLFGGRGLGCDCSAAEVIAIGETTWQDYSIYLLEIVVCVPEGDRGSAR